VPAVQADDGGIIWIIGDTAIESNYGDGVGAILNGEVVVCCADPPEDTSISNNAGFGFGLWMGGGLFFWDQTLVEGNLRGGVSVDSSEAYLSPTVLISGNGDPSDPNSYGRPVISSNARVQTNAAVIDNDGPGVFASGGATVSFGPSAVMTGNRGYGVELEAASTAHRRREPVCSSARNRSQSDTDT